MVVSMYSIESWEFIYSQRASEGPLDRKLLNTEKTVSRRIRVIRYHVESGRDEKYIQMSMMVDYFTLKMVLIKVEFKVKVHT